MYPTIYTGLNFCLQSGSLELGMADRLFPWSSEVPPDKQGFLMSEMSEMSGGGVKPRAGAGSGAGHLPDINRTLSGLMSA